MKYSIVIPVFNEQDNVRDLFMRLQSVMGQMGEQYEIIFVNDGSGDATLEILKQLSPIKIINFRQHFGQTAAMDAGIKESKGEILLTMDGDLQNDPFDIPNLIKKLDEGYDVVSGWRQQRKDSFSKRFFSRGAYVLRQIFLNDKIHDSGCSLKAYRRECFDQVDLYGEMHRFIPAILQWKGYKIGEVNVNHFPRINGKTKYNWNRMLKGLIDVLHLWFWRKYSARPLHLFGTMGVVLIFLGSIGAGYSAYLKFILDADLSNNAIVILAVFLFLAGIQLFVSGILIDIAIKNYYRKLGGTPYSIKEIIEN